MSRGLFGVPVHGRWQGVSFQATAANKPDYAADAQPPDEPSIIRKRVRYQNNVISPDLTIKCGRDAFPARWLSADA
jgi:hypothetical protein